MVDVAALAVKVDTTDLKRGEAALGKLTAKGARAEDQMQDLGRASRLAGQAINGSGQSFRNATGAANQFTGGIRGVSLQLSQVAQQGAVTGNYLQALAIQLPDLALGFGPLGILLGAVAGGLATFAINALSAQAASDSLDDSMSDLSDAVNTYRQQVDLMSASSMELDERFGSNAREARRAAIALAEFGRADALRALNDVIANLDVSRLRDLIAIVQDGPGEIAAFSDNFNRALSELQDEFGVTQAEAFRLFDALEALQSAQGPEQATDAANALNAVVIDIYGNVSDVPPALYDVVRAAAEAALTAADLSAAIEDAEAATGGLIQAFYTSADAIYSNLPAVDSMIASVSDLAAAAWDYAMGMASANAAFNRAAAQSNMVYSGRGGDPSDFTGDAVTANVDFQDALSQADRLISARRVGGGGRRGGGGGGGRRGGADNAEREAERAGQAFDRLMGSLDPLLDAQQEFADNQKIVNDALAAGKITAADYDTAMAAVGEAYARAVEEIESANLASDIRSISEDLAAATDSWESFGQAAVGALQRIAQEFVANQFEDILRSLAGLSPLSREGGGGLIGAFFGGFRAEGGPVSAGKAYVVGEKGPEIFAPNSGGQIVPNNMMGGGMSDAQVGRLVKAIEDQSMNVNQTYVNAAGPDQVAAGLRSRAARSELKTFIREEGLARG